MKRFLPSIIVTIVSATVLATGATAQHSSSAFGATEAHFPDGVDKVVVPFEYTLGKIIIPVRVNGSPPLRFVLDTGAPVGIIPSGELANLLVKMRGKIERELGPGQPLKAGPGGYYDIDFILLYLRLREASLFFQSLNTPERISVIRSMEGLTPDQADLMQRNAVFYRSLDHAIRVATGHSAKGLPTTRSLQAIVSELVGRWVEAPPGAPPLPEQLEQVRRTTRGLFLDVFPSAENPPAGL